MEKRIDFVDRLARHGVSSTRFSTTFVDIRVGPWRFHADPEDRGEPGAVGPRFGIACLGPTAACAGLGALNGTQSHAVRPTMGEASDITSAARQEPRLLRLQCRADDLQGPGQRAGRRRRMAHPRRQLSDLRPARRREKPSRLGHRPRPGRERIPRVLHPNHRSGPAHAGGAPRTRPRKPVRKARSLSPPDPRRPRLCAEGPGRNQRALRAHLGALRKAIAADHRKPALR